MKRAFNRTKVAKKNKPKKRVLKLGPLGKAETKVKSKNSDPLYSNRGTRAKGKHYDGQHQNLKRVEDDKYAELDCD